MADMIFEDVEGQPIPRLTRDASGAERQADGQTLFDLDQAAKHFQRTSAELRTLWRCTWSDLIGLDETDDSNPVTGNEQPPAPAVEPAGVSAPTPQVRPTLPADPSIRARLAVLRRMMFGHLSDEHFDAFIELCRIYELNPFAKQVYARVQPSRDNAKVMEVVVIVSIHGLRLQADRTGLYAGNDDAVYEYDSADQLRKATATVWKLVNGERIAFTASAYWAEYRPLSDDPNSLADQMPHNFLARCAEALAIRKAFPRETGRLYTPEEMEQAFARQNIEGQQAAPRRLPVPTLHRPGMPQTFDAFCSAMEQRGYDNDELVKVIADYRRKHPALADANPRAFWAKILESLPSRQAAVA